MSIRKQLLVAIPDDKGIHVKTAGAKGEQYVYKYVHYFRNADGQPRNKAKAIGKLDPASGKMYPNNTYFELYAVAPSLPDVSVWDYGYSYTVRKICQDLNLLECLFHAFGQRAMDIVVMAAYIIREGSTMDGIDDWLQRTLFPGYDHLITSQESSRLFASLSESQIEAFFTHWVKTAYHGGSVCYDVTSISSYAQEMPGVERGYNRDGENLAQFNLGIFCDETAKTPLYYNRYNGSLTDRTNLSYVLANAKAIGLENISLVLDGGFWSEDCLKSLQSHCPVFTVGMPTFLKESEKILETYAGGIESYANELDDPHVYGVSVDTVIHGVPGRVLLYYDSWNHLNLCGELSNRIQRLKAELSELKRYPKNKLKRYTPYFILTKHEHGSGFDYAVDKEKVEASRKKKGYFLLFSTDRASSPSDILDYYRAKDADEKLFAQIKIEMDGRRVRTHNEQTTEGKTFVLFIASILRSRLLKKLSPYLKDHPVSLKKVLNQLSNIRLLSGQEGYRFAKALTKNQKEILSVFDAVSAIKVSLNDL